MGEIIFKTELIKGAKGDRGEAGQADSIPTDGVIAFQGETVPDGYEETDPGDVFDEVYEDINAVKDMIADEYDNTATYNAGDFCIHENSLYKCIATTTGLWDGSKWVLTSAGDEIKANTAAIEAIVNVSGACNLCPTSTTTTTKYGITFTVNSDGSVTASGIADSGHVATIDIMPKTDLHYGTYKGSGGVNEHCRIIYGRSNSSGTVIDTVDDSGEGIELTVNASTPKVSMALIIDAGTDLTTPVTFYPMLYDARLKPTGYVPYAMTNRELTEKMEVKTVTDSDSKYLLCEFNGFVIITLNGFSGTTLPLSLTRGENGVTQFYDTTSKDNVHINISANGVVVVNSSADTTISNYALYGTCILRGSINE